MAAPTMMGHENPWHPVAKPMKHPGRLEPYEMHLLVRAAAGGSTRCATFPFGGGSTPHVKYTAKHTVKFHGN